jgi:hypothetical protein
MTSEDEEFARIEAEINRRQGDTPPATPVQDPVAWVDLLKQAEEVVRSKSLWKKYIDGTPLANDIAVWMASFAQEHAAPPAPQPVPVKTYHDGKPWPVQPAPDPVPIIQQLVTALEGSGTRMRSDQWYIEIEAVAAGKFYLNSKGANHD